ncbi:3135_t:CDS:2 [Ambispora leptoticha]|uniref:3135_t:CDS:1 n=1 Tax=Ambispora leptoticha TaxID=144679 RepID=A0A9N8Z335_9GLOM|nr:3135_t:CDS:2 [Ambispora leptoticha]
MFHALSQGDELDNRWEDYSPHEVNERSYLLHDPNEHTQTQLINWIGKTWRRAIILNFLPVSLVLIWVSIPFPTHDPNPNNEAYNAIALLLITKIFDLYSLNWWPKWLGGVFAYTVFWLLSLTLGVFIYLFTGLEKYTLTWVLLTFLTMAMPLLVAFIVIRSQNRNTYRHSLTLAQKTFLERQLPYRIPASYLRFLWFCCALSIALLALIAGEGYAYVFLSTLPHNGWDGLVYVYSWVVTIYIFDSLTDYIIETRIKSYPLSSVFKLYFFMIYFIFYRNLFARLRSWNQFFIVQLANSLWVCIFYPLCMTQPVYMGLVYFAGVTKTYDQYKKHLGRSFFLRNLAENATMLGFLCWVLILHYGPNKRAYPYFQFDDGNEYTVELTVKASIGVWISELTSSYVTRHIFRKAFKHSVSEEAVKDFVRYPEMIVTMMLVVIHVLQDMLLATLKLNFEGGNSAIPVPHA